MRCVLRLAPAVDLPYTLGPKRRVARLEAHLLQFSPPTYWTTAVTHRGEEERAAAHCENQQFEIYLPRFAALKRGRDGRYAERRELLFPGYLMVQLHDGWKSLWSTRGIQRLMVPVGAELPVPMPANAVAAIKQREDDCGLIRLGEIVGPRFKPGSKVVVDTDDAFAGISGIVQDTPALERCVVLLRMLGREVSRAFDERQLSAA